MKLTPQQFLNEVSHLRTAWGTVEFWQDKARTDNAIKALGICYLNTEPDEKWDQEDLAMVYDITVTEFSRRETYMMLRKVA